MLGRMVDEIVISDKSEGIRKIFEIERIPFMIDENIKGVMEVGKNRIVIDPSVIKGIRKRDVSFAKLVLNDKIYDGINDLLKKFNFYGVYLPIKEIFELEGEYEILAEFVIKSERVPAIVRNRENIIFLFDIDKLFTSLVYEEYFKKESERHILSNDLLDSLYKKIPYRLRIATYRRYYKKIHSKIDNGFKTDFPIYPGSYILMELIKESIKVYTPLIRISRWPNNKEFCLMLTHDVEPSKYSYTIGVNELLNVLEKYERKGTIMLVASYAKKYLNNEIIDKIKNHDMGSHGLYHDRKFLLLDEEARKLDLGESKRILEGLTGKNILFFRAPAFQRPDNLFYELEDVGYRYDSSMIDVQREEPYCGKGNSFFLPFYKKDSFILELPVSAPDCISPYFFGMSMEETIDLFKMKLEWLRDVNGLGVFIVHAPAWGKEDSENRLRLLEAILDDKRLKDAWNATASEVYDWWKKREGLEVIVRKNKVIVRNLKNGEVNEFFVIIEDGKKVKGKFIEKIMGRESIIIDNV